MDMPLPPSEEVGSLGMSHERKASVEKDFGFHVSLLGK